MNLGEFYRAVLPPEGNYTLFHGGRHSWATTIDGLVELTEKHAAEADWYFAVGSFLGKKRLQAEVVGKKSFYLDIDAGQDKFEKNPTTAWPTIGEAARALAEFTAKFKLPPSIVVHSGGGLHVYYVLDHAIDGVVWTAIADRFKAVTKHLELRADPTSTSDSARILRPLGSLHKSGARVSVIKETGRVYTVAEIEAAIAAIPLPGHVSLDLTNVADIVSEADLINNDFKQFEPVPTSARKIVPECGALREVAEAKGNVVEPQWRAMIGLVKHCVEGAELVHEWSQGHPSYSYLDTQEKFDRYKAGPTLCETFGSYTKACLTCPHAGKIKSPITLGRINEVEAQDETLSALIEATKPEVPPPPSGVPEGVLPAGYKISERDGRMMLWAQHEKVVDKIKTTFWVAMTEDIFWIEGWTDSGVQENNGSTVMLCFLSKGMTKRYEMPTAYVSDRRSLLQFLTSKTIQPANFDNETIMSLQQYVNDQIKRIKDSASRPVIRGHLGFHMNKAGALYCAHGEYIIEADGTIRRGSLDKDLSAVRGSYMIEPLGNVEQQWTPAIWSRIREGAMKQAGFYKKWWGGEDMGVAQLAMMLQLASPLIMFAAEADFQPEGPLPGIGLTVSLFSNESAKGKTSIQSAASYAYGDAGQIMRQGDRLSMTFNSLIGTAASLGTMPFPLDEVTTNDKTQVGEMVNRIASGVEKARANKHGRVQDELLRWALISVVSTNVPQRELVQQFQRASDALQMRLIELDCDRLPTRTLDMVPIYDAALHEAMDGNKGCLGAMIHLYCCNTGYARMRAKMREKMNYIPTLAAGEIKERFILRGIAAMLVLNDILHDMKIDMFDTKVLESQALDCMNVARSFSLKTQRENGSNFLRMVRDLAPQILITPEDIPLDDSFSTLENPHAVRTPYIGRFCRKSQTLYLSHDACQQWAMENQYSLAGLLNDARRDRCMLPFPDGKETGWINYGQGIRGVFITKDRAFKLNTNAMQLDRVITNSAKVVRLHVTDQSEETPQALDRSS